MATHGRAARVDDLVTALLTASRALVGISAASIAGVEDRVTLPQFRALVLLEGVDGAGVNWLADRLGVAPSTATRMVDRLVASGMVTRTDDPADRRQVVVRLTGEGRDVVATVTDRRRAELARIVGRMPSDRRAALVDALTAFADAAGESAAGPAAPLGW